MTRDCCNSQQSMIVTLLVTIVVSQSVSALAPPNPKAWWLPRARTSTTVFGIRARACMTLRMNQNQNTNNDDGEEIEKDNDAPLYYDDFGDMMGGDDASTLPDQSRLSTNNDASEWEASSWSMDQLSAGADSGLFAQQQQLLRERMDQVAAQEEFERQKVQNNWLQGNWCVRGVSLDHNSHRAQIDESDAMVHDEDARRLQSRGEDLDGRDNRNNDNMKDPIYISTCVVQSPTNDDDLDNDCDEDDEDVVLWMGRTDGSLVAVRYSDTETWAQFTTQLVSSGGAGGNDIDSFTVQPALVRDESALPKVSDADDPDDKHDEEVVEAESNQVPDPFEVVAQALRAPNQAPVEHLLPLPQHQLVLTYAQSGSDIQAWAIPDSFLTERENSSPRFLTPQTTWSSGGVLSSALVALNAVPIKDSSKSASLVCSVSQDGQVGLWNVSHTGAGLQARWNLFASLDDEQSSQDAAVSAAQITSEHFYVGTTTGKVLIYAWAHILERIRLCEASDSNDKAKNVVREIFCEPVGRLTASSDEIAVTAIASVTIDNNNKATSFLVAGDQRGTVKQWQLFSREDGRVEAWPKLATQKLQDRAHVFQHLSLGLEPETNSAHSIMDLQFVDSGRMLLSASADTIRCWNTSTGKQSHTLAGFEGLSRIGVLPTPRAAFCTNGMKNVVCIHDYQIDESNDGCGDDDFDVSEYLEFDR